MAFYAYILRCRDGSYDVGHTDDIDHLTARLRMLDDRFRFVNRSIVRDSLALHYSRCTPIVID